MCNVILFYFSGLKDSQLYMSWKKSARIASVFSETQDYEDIPHSLSFGYVMFDFLQEAGIVLCKDKTDKVLKVRLMLFSQNISC